VSVPTSFSDTWPAVAASVPIARHAVLHHLRDAETKDPPLADVGLAVSEAVTNVVHHAYVGQACGTVRVTLEFSADELKLVVEDDGRGLRPRVDSPGAGMGLSLMATVSDRFDTHTGLDEGTRICAWFRRDPRGATLH
jgi:serine/threonine-protein kinase RsbW